MNGALTSTSLSQYAIESWGEPGRTLLTNPVREGVAGRYGDLVDLDRFEGVHRGRDVRRAGHPQQLLHAGVDHLVRAEAHLGKLVGWVSSS